MKKITMKNSSWVLCLFLCLVVGLSSCKTIEKIVEVPVVHTEYIAKLDTTIIHDSIWYEKQVKNDTVYLFKDRYHDKYVFQHDTICRVDSVTVVQEVEIVKNELSARQATMITLFWVLLALIVLYIGLKIYLRIKYGK